MSSSCKSSLSSVSELVLTLLSRALFVVFSILNSVEPFHQHFSLKNYTLQYSYAVHERVPVTVLYFVAIIIPIAILVVYTLIIDGIFSHQKSKISPSGGRVAPGSRYRFKDRLWELNCAILGILMSSISAYVITGALKNATGKPRPDLIDRCRPRDGSVDAPVFGLSNSSICTQTDHGILKDGFRSFPSGHSSCRSIMTYILGQMLRLTLQHLSRACSSSHSILQVNSMYSTVEAKCGSP